MATTLDQARVTPEQVAACLHRLAAVNHRQWAQWEQHVLPTLLHDSLRPVEEIIQQLLPNPATALLNNARVAATMVEASVGGFAYRPYLEVIAARKQQQLEAWVAYARGQIDQKLERWRLQCRTPFLRLSPEQQVSDYAEAREDLRTIAEAGGLVLPDPLPDVQPLSTKEARRARRRHAFGLHGGMMVSEHPWSLTCQGCHQTQGGFVP